MLFRSAHVIYAVTSDKTSHSSLDLFRALLIILGGLRRIFTLLISFTRAILLLFWLGCTLLSGSTSLTALHHTNGLVVKIAFDASRCLKIVVGLEELIELEKVRPHVIHAHSAILVKIKAHVAVSHEHLHVGVSPLNVGDELFLPLSKNFNEHANEVSCLVVVKHDLIFSLLQKSTSIHCA